DAPEKFQRPACGLGGVVGLPDDGDGARGEQRVAKIRVGELWKCHRQSHSAASAGLGRRWSNRRAKVCSAMRVLRISIEPPARIQPRQRRMHHSTRLSWLYPIAPIIWTASPPASKPPSLQAPLPMSGS